MTTANELRARIWDAENHNTPIKKFVLKERDYLELKRELHSDLVYRTNEYNSFMGVPIEVVYGS